MIIFFITRQTNVCNLISNRLKNHSCYIYSDIKILSQILKTGTFKPDLIIADYTLYNHDIFNVYDTLKKIRNPIPLIFYNDPCIIGNSKSFHWKYMINFIYPEERNNPDKFTQIFKELEQIVESQDLKPFMQLNPQPKDLTTHEYAKMLLDNTTDDDNIIQNINDKLKLNRTYYLILKILYETKNTQIKLSEIEKELEKNNIYINCNSLKVEISKLRKKLSDLSDFNVQIIGKKEGYQLILAGE